MAKVTRLPKTRKPVELIPPPHLNHEARAHWSRVIEQLEPGRELLPEDSDLLAMYCDYYARWVQARERIDAMGLVVKGADGGKPVQNPFIAIADQCAQQMRVLLGELTITPAARRKMREFQERRISADDLSRISIKVPDDHSRH